MEYQGAAKNALRKFTVNPQSNKVCTDELMSYASYSFDCYLQNIDRKIKHMANKRDTLTVIPLCTVKIQYRVGGI
jgi:hypothetical protein